MIIMAFELKRRIESDKIIIGPKRLTRYEYAAILATLSVQIAYGAPIPLTQKELRQINESDPIEIAKLLIRKKKIPLTVLRYLPTGEFQAIPISKLEIVED